MTALFKLVTPAPCRDETFAILTDAFEGDPGVRAYWPERADYRRHFPTFAELFAGAPGAGVTDLSGDDGAALWLPPGVEPEAEPLLAYLEATLPPDRRDAILAGLEIQGGLHPQAPHWYLPFIGVRPKAQGRGTGFSLLARGLARADAGGMPAYLGATSRRSVPLYRRFGFYVIGTVEAEGYPEIFAMWRPARRH